MVEVNKVQDISLIHDKANLVAKVNMQTSSLSGAALFVETLEGVIRPLFLRLRKGQK